MLKYTDLEPNKKAYVFELDNVLIPERDYLLQVYYLFSNFIEFTETVPTGKELTDFFKTAYEHHGSENIFDRAKEAFNLDEKYRENFRKLHYTARLPLKLLLYNQMLTLLQELVIDRKQIFLITNGDTEVQLNKIRQTEWNGLEKYLKVYFAQETNLKPETNVFDIVLNQHQLIRKEITIIGNSAVDEEFALSCGVDYIPSSTFM
ncbi:HAD family hydrolase [Daejeonella oryzae]|uniref:HAD family hydrolase n=1 Tax=Daejeonella oryzae TaxID=1122943 RepID=UPI00047B4A11|nr:HAD hydrolase-like protein [Daejeonella oryzae]